jgi:hypothetical protein
MGCEVSNGEDDGAASAADLGQQLSTLLGHPVAFHLRATPENWPALIDITMIFTGLNNNQAAKAVRRLLEEHPEFKSSRLKFKFEGRGDVRQVPLFFSTPGFCTQSRFLRVIPDALLLQRTHWPPARRLTLRLS